MGKRATNYTQSRGLRLLPYQEQLVSDAMEIEGLTRSGAIRFLLGLGAHALKQEDRLSQKLDAMQAQLEGIESIVRSICREI